jgi:hypothetical protein
VTLRGRPWPALVVPTCHETRRARSPTRRTPPRGRAQIRRGGRGAGQSRGPFQAGSAQEARTGACAPRADRRSRTRASGAARGTRYESGVHRVQRVPETEARAGSTPRPRRWRCCPRPTRSRSRSTRTTSASTSSARPARAARASTPPTRPCASPTCRPGSWSPARTRSRSSRTRTRRCGCLKPPARRR